MGAASGPASEGVSPDGEEEEPEEATATSLSLLDWARLFLILTTIRGFRHLGHYFGGKPAEWIALCRFILPFVRFSRRIHYTQHIARFICVLSSLEAANPLLAERFLNNHFISMCRADGHSRPADHVNEELNKYAKKVLKKGKISEKKLSRAAVMTYMLKAFDNSFPFSLTDDEARVRPGVDLSPEIEKAREVLRDLGFHVNTLSHTAVPYPFMTSKLALVIAEYKTEAKTEDA